MVFPGIGVNLEQIESLEDLDNHSRGDDGGNSEFHEGSAVGGENGAHPEEGVSGLGADDSVERDLTGDQVDQQREHRPEDLISK